VTSDFVPLHAFTGHELAQFLTRGVQLVVQSSWCIAREPKVFQSIDLLA
jgi:hypothetical protein